MIDTVNIRTKPSCKASRRRTVSNLINLTSCKMKTKTEPPNLAFSYVNIGSVKNKTTSLKDYVIQNKFDVIALTETWLYLDEYENAVPINELVPKGYCFKHTPRQDGRIGGGVGLLHHRNVEVVVSKSRKSICASVTQFEYFECAISVTNDPRSRIILLIVYRPPPTKKNKLKLKSFWREWKKVLSTMAKDHRVFAVVGDLNFHLDNLDHPDTQKFNQILDELSLVQLVKVPTHTAGHTLDVVITQPENEIIITDTLSVHDPGISSNTGDLTRCHHFAVSFSMSFCKPVPICKTIYYRNLKNLDVEAFTADWEYANLEEEFHRSNDLDKMVEKFVDTTVTILDKHAPVLSKQIIQRSSNSWYTPELLASKQTKRRLERRWMKSRLECHRIEYRKHCALYSKLLYDTEIKHTQDDISACERDKAKLFKYCKTLIDVPKTQIQIDGCNTNKESASALSSFFKTKTEGIQAELEAEGMTMNSELPAFSKLNMMTVHKSIPKLAEFEEVTTDYVEKLIVKSNNKSCRLDLIPVQVLKSLVKLFVSCVTIIINLSLKSGYVPKSFKNAIVIPSIKKYDMDPSVLASYRPVSNLPFLSKVLEKVVYSQIEKHLDKYKLLPPSQSAYRKRHSTETSLLKVNNDILTALNEGKCTLLVKLDISAAFDTVNHEMLLQRYSALFGLSDTVLSWFASYLSGRRQSVQVGSDVSNIIEMLCGFAQGSTLGGPKYNMFVTPLDELIKLHEVNHEAYADDSNVYISFDLKNATAKTSAISQMEQCLSDIKRWMVKNKLKLNCGKTEAVLFHPPRAQIDKNMFIMMSNKKISISFETVSLGVIFDSKMCMTKHVNITSRNAYFHLRRISKARNRFNKSITQTLVNSLVTSRLDYCNSLLCALPKKLLQKLQYVQNAAAKLILLKGKRDHVTPLLKELHWLPVKYRTEFKTLVITWKIMHDMAPLNISDLVIPYRPQRSLRSNNENFLARPYISRNSAGHRAFSNLAPFLWNSIPSSLRKAETIGEFKAKLKTHFFIEHFGSGS